jgi:hypothetical protein
MSRCRKFNWGQRESGDYIGPGNARTEAKILAAWISCGKMSREDVIALVEVPVATERVLRQFAMQGDRDDRRMVNGALGYRQQVLAELHRQLGKRTNGEGNGP